MAEKSKIEGADDLFPDLGNMGQATLEHLRGILDKNDPVVMESYESMVEDFIGTFGHAVLQGVPPEWALFSFSQAFAITLGMCIRANLPQKEAAQMVYMIAKNARLSAEMVKQVTTVQVN